MEEEKIYDENLKKYNDILTGSMESLLLVNANKSLTDTRRLASFDFIFDCCIRELHKLEKHNLKGYI